MHLKALIIAAAVGLCGCVPYSLTGADVIPTDARLTASGYKFTPGASLRDEGVRLGLSVSEETLAAPFGSIALTRLEHAEPRPLIVFCGGNMFRRGAGGARIMERLAPLGDVWIFDYPGYGDSGGSGSPSEFEALGPILSARVGRAFTEGRAGGLAFWGHSFGGNVCADLAGRTRVPSDLVLAATFQSFDQVVRAGASARAGPLGFLVRPVIGADVPRYDVAQALNGYAGAVVVIGAEDDDTVPYLASQRLKQTLRRQGVRTEMVTLASANHSRLHETPGLIERVGAILRQGAFGNEQRGWPEGE